MRTDQSPPDALPQGVRHRLSDHYGREVSQWLDGFPELIGRLARDLDLTILSFHDAGWTSVIAVCEHAGKSCVLKVTPDAERFERERAALMHWRGARVGDLLHTDTARKALLLSAVGGTPGGATRPEDHACRVSAALPVLHRRAADDNAAVPNLGDYQRTVVKPRIRERLRRLPHRLADEVVEAVRALDVEELGSSESPTMLQADLYAENILFDGDGLPVFIDPHPMRGPATFDWAFWCVYYTANGFESRLHLCREIRAVPLDEVLTHAAVLALDGYLYYLDTSDPRAGSIRVALHRAVQLLTVGTPS